MNSYQKAILDARKQFLKLNKKQEKELLNLYKDLSNQLKIDISNCRTTSSEAYLKNLQKIVNDNIKNMSSDLKNIITTNINTSSEIASSVDYVYYKAITEDVSLLTSINNMVINTSRKTVETLIKGEYYKDGLTLDKRIWNINKSNRNDINKLIEQNILRGANSRKLAKEVEKYVNPFKRTDAKTVVSGMSTKVSYQAQRLARTSITHAFAETTINNAKTNPFNVGLKWNLSPSHERDDICDEYADRIFKPEEYPLEHPNGHCYPTEENIPIYEAIEELKAWTKGESNPKLDEWYSNLDMD